MPSVCAAGPSHSGAATAAKRARCPAWCPSSSRAPACGGLGGRPLRGAAVGPPAEAAVDGVLAMLQVTLGRHPWAAAPPAPASSAEETGPPRRASRRRTPSPSWSAAAKDTDGCAWAVGASVGRKDGTAQPLACAAGMPAAAQAATDAVIAVVVTAMAGLAPDMFTLGMNDAFGNSGGNPHFAAAFLAPSLACMACSIASEGSNDLNAMAAPLRLVLNPSTPRAALHPGCLGSARPSHDLVWLVAASTACKPARPAAMAGRVLAANQRA